MGKTQSERRQSEGWDYIHRRALYKVMGFRDEDLDKPLIAVVHGWSEMSPGHFHLKPVAEAVKAGVLAAGGTPLELPVPGVCGSLSGAKPSFRYNIPYRDFASAFIEIMLAVGTVQGAVFIPVCDNVVPAYLMAAARLNLPSLFLTGGYMAPGEVDGQTVIGADTMKGIGKLFQGKMTIEELVRLSDFACPTGGACCGMATANTMSVVTEALGMSLPGNSTLPATSDARLLRMARSAGERAVELIAQDIRPSSILTKKAFHNAIKTVIAVGGSTNAVIHIAAIAQETGLELDLELWDEYSRKIPFICSITPNNTEFTMRDLDRAGGIRAVMKELAPLLDGEVMTVTGRSLAEAIDSAEISDARIIATLGKPFSQEGGVGVMFGSLAPKGSIIKISSAPDPTAHIVGPAAVFDSEEAAITGFMENKIGQSDIIVVRYEGPRGSPGALEIMNLKHFITSTGRDVSNPLITDGRFSGSNLGLGICHVEPEAMDGGPIAIVQTGDMIEIDIPNRRLNLMIEEREIERRLQEWHPPEQKIERGALDIYARQASSFSRGATIFD